MPELYPLKFKPIYKEKIWGGRNLKNKFDKNIPDGNIGESWEITAQEDETSIIANGPLAGKSLTYLLNTKKEQLFGEKFNDQKNFPLLIKFLDAHSKLSVQVHPNEEYSNKFKSASSKTEMWYIIDAKPGAKIVYGLKENVAKNKLKEATKSGELDEYLREVSVKPGEFYFIPGGTVHAIEEGIFLAEIQQSSDTTYRLYDWDRKDEKGNTRPLHIEKAFDIINLPRKDNTKGVNNSKQEFFYQKENFTVQILTASPYFVVEKIQLNGTYNFNDKNDRFYILMNITESKQIFSEKKYLLQPGETMLLPAELNNVDIKGKGDFLKIYLPLNKNSIVNKLKNMEFTYKQIKQLPGFKYF